MADSSVDASGHSACTRALRWREDFQAFYDQPQQAAEAYLHHWCYGAKRSRLEPLKHFVKSVEEHWDGIISWHASRISNERASHCTYNRGCGAGRLVGLAVA